MNWTLRNKLQWNFNRYSNIFIKENASENVCEMASILSRPQLVKAKYWLLHYFMALISNNIELKLCYAMSHPYDKYSSSVSRPISKFEHGFLITECIKNTCSHIYILWITFIYFPGRIDITWQLVYLLCWIITFSSASAGLPADVLVNLVLAFKRKSQHSNRIEKYSLANVLLSWYSLRSITLCLSTIHLTIANPIWN